MGEKYILTAFGKDRPGIVADVTELLFDIGCNLEDSTMTLLGGEFTLILILEAPDRDGMGPFLDKSLRRLEREKGLSAFLRPVEPSGEKPAAARHTIRVEGMDQAGIVYRVSRYLAGLAVNITDLKSKRRHMPQSGAALYTMEIHVEVPKTLSLDQFDEGLAAVGEELNVEISW
ncbi:MAG: ACT domain-containing protein [Desulfobacterales bacterium]|jgi:glycine cleavage system transcriptional repressor